MDIEIHPKKLSGSVCAIPSKSQAHRLLICAAFSDQDTVLKCPDTNQDIEATAACLTALGANIHRDSGNYYITPIGAIPQKAVLSCGESGSTLRFLLPIAGALGIDTEFRMKGRLPSRPLSPLWEQMESHGCILTRPSADTIRCQGKLQSGEYEIDGGVSSQFITGLLFALSLLDSRSMIRIAGKLESKPYVDMTQKAMSLFGVETKGFIIESNQKYRTPGTVMVEGDWSNAAFFLTAQALGNAVSVSNLNFDSPQGDRAICEILPALKEKCTVCCENIPDLVPILSVAAAANQGAVFTNVARLRLKESDRVASVMAMLNAYGIDTEATQDTLTVFPGKFHGCRIDSANDHRIAMAAAIAATIADGTVTISNAQCVSKSYPKFWEEYARLGGQYEQYLR